MTRARRRRPPEEVVCFCFYLFGGFSFFFFFYYTSPPDPRLPPSPGGFSPVKVLFYGVPFFFFFFSFFSCRRVHLRAALFGARGRKNVFSSFFVKYAYHFRDATGGGGGFYPISTTINRLMCI